MAEKVKLQVSPGSKTNTTAVGARPLLARLPHYGPDGRPMVFPDPGFQANEALQEKLDEALTGLNRDSKRAKPAVDLLKVPHVLIDLTHDPAKPRLAGHDLHAQRHPASVSKLACLVAAHQLSQDLRAMMHEVKTREELFALARKKWSDAQAAAPVRVGKRTFSASKFALPNLEAIFAPGWPLATKPKDLVPGFHDTGLSWPDEIKFEWPTRFPGYQGKLERLPGKGGAAKALVGVGFKERVDLMIGQSHNEATGSCVHDVGYLYLASVLLATGLYDLERGGLWMGASFGGTIFTGDPVHGQTITASPYAVARLMTLLATGKLVSPEASRAMLPLLHKVGFPQEDYVTYTDIAPNGVENEVTTWGHAEKHMNRERGAGTRSPFMPFAHEPQPDPPWTVYSKIGIISDKDPLGYSDAAWIKRKPDGRKENSYVLVALRTSDAALKDLAKAALYAVEQTSPRA